MATVIAEIRLAPGEVGYYDDYSRIYLNSARPTAKIYAGMNTTQIRRSIRSGRLRLISGSLNPEIKQEEKPVKPAPKAEKPEIKNEVKTENVQEEISKPVEPAVVETAPDLPAAEPIAEETPTVEEIPAEEAPIEEAPAKPKRSRRKKAE